MDKKSKKRIDVLHSNLQRLRQQLSGVQKQKDDLDEVQNLQKQIASVEAELQSLTRNQNPGSKR
jgi:DNA-binding FrmR family transcriptional regulator